MKDEHGLTPELLARAREGDKDALTSIYEATCQELYRSIRIMVHSDEQAMDLQQDTYIRAFSHLDQLRDPAALLPWLRRIAVNLTKNALRKKTPVLFSELIPAETEELELPDPTESASPEWTVDRRETARQVRDILNGLSDGQRMLVGLYYYEQQSVPEIARILSVSEGTVKTQLHRARAKVEAAVKKLEKNGVKLLGLAPTAYLTALLRRQELPAAEAGANLSAVLAETEAASDAAAGLHVGKTFFQRTVGKLVLTLLAAGLLGGAVYGVNRWNHTRQVRNRLPTDPVLKVETTAPTSRPSPSTEPTEPPLPSDSTEATEPTEPVTEEPQTTAPTEEPQTTVPTEEPHPSDATEGPQPTAPTEETEPAAPTAESGSPADSRISRWEVFSSGKSFYGSGLEPGTISDIPWKRSFTIYVYMNLERPPSRREYPTVSNDNPKVVQVQPTNSFLGGTGVGCFWDCESLGPGVAHLTFDFGDDGILRFTVNNPEYPDQLITVEGGRNWEDCSPKTNMAWIRTGVQGTALPELITDNPSVVMIGKREEFYGGMANGFQSDWIRHIYEFSVRIVGTGDAHIYLKLNGKVERTWNVHSHEDPPASTTEPPTTEPPMTEPLTTELPTTAPPATELPTTEPPQTTPPASEPPTAAAAPHP